MPANTCLDARMLAGNRRRNHHAKRDSLCCSGIAQKDSTFITKFITIAPKGHCCTQPEIHLSWSIIAFLFFIHLDRIDGAGTRAYGRMTSLMAPKGTDLLAASRIRYTFRLGLREMACLGRCPRQRGEYYERSIGHSSQAESSTLITVAALNRNRVLAQPWRSPMQQRKEFWPE